MTTLTEGRHTAEFLISEAPGTRSREVVTLAIQAQPRQAGTVLGQITVSGATQGQYTEFDADAANGSETAAAVLFAEVDATVAAKAAVVIKRDAEVAGNALGWKTGADASDKAAGTADLAALGIIVR